MEQRGPSGFDRLDGQNKKRRERKANGSAPANAGVTLDDFFAYMPMYCYIFAPSREMWPGASARVPPICTGKDENGEGDERSTHS